MNAELWNLVQACLTGPHFPDSESRGDLKPIPIYTSDRTVYKIESSRSNESYALKVRPERAVKDEDKDDNASDREFRLLAEIRDRIDAVGLQIEYPKPIRCFPKQRAILTKWCDGQQLKQAFYNDIWRSPKRAPHLLTHFRNCGKWLGEFHSAMGTDHVAASFVETRLMHVERMIDEVRLSRSNLLSDEDLSLVHAKISGWLASPESARTGRIHGNFTLRNVLVSENGVAPVDFEDSRHDILLCDTGQLIADILAAAYRPFSRADLRLALIASFASGYECVQSIDRSVLSGFTLYHMLATYYEVVTRQTQNQITGLISSYQARTFAPILQRFEDAFVG